MILLKSVRAHVLITGFVQNVNFRFYAKKKADSLGLKGWVKNLESDTVEAVFEGNENKVNEMLEWCSKGPPSATVDDVETELSNYIGDLESFDIIF